VPAFARFAFERFELDPAKGRLTSSGEPVAISARHLDVLLLLVVRAGQIVSKDELLQAGWKDVAVGDNSLEQAIASLRRILGTHPGGITYIETVPRRGYRFGAPVTQLATRESDAGLDALLSPHRAFLEGRAALESLEREQIVRAREVFEGALQTVPENASAHVGLANACIMQFEMTRADPKPDTQALESAARHAREACRLNPEWGEAWATLGFVLDRTGDRVDALAASKRAVTLEPDNWQHQFRLAYLSWGEERLRAARRTLTLMPDLPLAHWLAATVHVARQSLDAAERELITALASESGSGRGDGRFSTVALHWLRGLLYLTSGDERRAIEEFELELSREDSGILYARECCANTWYALGALRLRQGRRTDAARAFEHALDRVSSHAMARVGLMAARPSDDSAPLTSLSNHGAHAFEAAVVRAAQLAITGAHADAAGLIDEALAGAAPGGAGWVLPLEPLLNVHAHPDAWTRPLARLRNRAA
jgi:DNA-binding winged helix-turn-helix (wHTH) protein